MPIMASDVGTIFLICVLFHPTEAERISGGKKKIVVDAQFILAESPAAASNSAIMLTPKEFDPDRCEVLVTQPF